MQLERFQRAPPDAISPKNEAPNNDAVLTRPRATRPPKTIAPRQRDARSGATNNPKLPRRTSCNYPLQVTKTTGDEQQW